MYKQVLPPKKISIKTKILLTTCIVLFIALFYFISYLFFENNASQVVLGVILCLFIMAYLFMRSGFSTYEYILQDKKLTLNQIINKRIVKQEIIDCDKIKFSKNAKKSIVFCHKYDNFITIEYENKFIKFSPDEKIKNYIKMSDTDAFIEENRNNIINLAKELIAVPSVKSEAKENMPFGENCAKVLEKTLDFCLRLGMKTKNIDNYCGWAEIGDGEKIIGIMCHLDVMPAGDGWNTNPFCATVTNDEIFGRGAIDDKGPCAVAIYAVKAVKESKKDIPVRIRLIFGCDEESGWACMERYKKTEELPDIAFTPDADFPVIYAEKGIAHLSLETSLSEGEYGLYVYGGQRANMVPAKARAVIIGNIDKLFEKLNNYDIHSRNLEFSTSGNKLEIISYGVNAHGSTPELGKNAFFNLFEFIDYLDLGSSQGKFASDFVKMFNNKTDGSGVGLKISDEISGALSLNVGLCFIGKNDIYPQMNDDSCKTIIDIRFPVTKNLDDVTIKLESSLPDDWEIDVLNYQAPLNIPKNSPLVQTLAQVYGEYTNGNSEPIVIGGGTYARAFPGRAVAFGAEFPNKESNAHQPNESINIEDMILSGKMFATAINRLIDTLI